MGYEGVEASSRESIPVLAAKERKKIGSLIEKQN